MVNFGTLKFLLDSVLWYGVYVLSQTICLDEKNLPREEPVFSLLEYFRLLEQPLFVGLTLLFLGLAFYRLYLARPACSPESACAKPRARKRQRLAFWIVAAVVLGLIAVPWFAPLFY